MNANDKPQPIWFVCDCHNGSLYPDTLSPTRQEAIAKYVWMSIGSIDPKEWWRDGHARKSGVRAICYVPKG